MFWSGRKICSFINIGFIVFSKIAVLVRILYCMYYFFTNTITNIFIFYNNWKGIVVKWFSVLVSHFNERMEKTTFWVFERFGIGVSCYEFLHYCTYGREVLSLTDTTKIGSTATIFVSCCIHSLKLVANCAAESCERTVHFSPSLCKICVCSYLHPRTYVICFFHTGRRMMS